MLPLPKKTSKRHVSPPSSGKRKGSKNWSTGQINLLLEIVSDILPAGKEMWEKVAVECREVDESWIRPGESCKHKFEKMAFAKQPTGQSDIPLHILRAKKIKESIAQNEVLGCVYQNDEGYEDGDDDEENTCSILSSASLLSESQGVRRPVTKAQKSREVSEAIGQIGKDNLAGAAQLTSALTKMAEALQTTTPSGVAPSVKESEFDASKIREFDAMKDDIANIKGTMTAILDHLKNKNK